MVNVGLVLEFGAVPSSPNYGRAVRLAAKLPGYSTYGSGNSLRHSAPFVEDAADSWFKLLEIVKEWKSALILKGDISVSPRKTPWVLRCFRDRLDSEDRAKYCFSSNWIGCRQLREGQGLYIVEKAGRFVGQDRFKPNKAKIMESVKDSFDECGICPAFEMERITEQITSLPEEINFKSNINWKPMYETDQASGKLLFSGLEYKTIDEDEPDMLEVEDPDQLRDYINENVRLTYFEHKLITLSETEWNSFENEGTNEKIEVAGSDKWELITVVNKADKWYCLFKREKEYELEDQEDVSEDND